MRGKSKKKIFIILIALIVILGIAYKAVLAPTIKSRQIQAKMQVAQKCIEANEFDKSIDLLEEVQNLVEKALVDSGHKKHIKFSEKSTNIS